MLTDLCQELRNWFDRNKPKLFGSFSIHDDDVFYVYNGQEKSLGSLGLANNQYFRIIDSTFNDGVVKYEQTELHKLQTETFYGAVWFMAIPPAVISLNAKIDDWLTKYGDVSFSPYTSETFGHYSYNKGSASSSGSGGNASTWQSAFKSELNRWRKI